MVSRADLKLLYLIEMCQLNLQNLILLLPHIQDLPADALRAQLKAQYWVLVVKVNEKLKIFDPAYHRARLVERGISERGDELFDFDLQTPVLETLIVIPPANFPDAFRAPRHSIQRISLSTRSDVRRDEGLVEAF